MNAESDTFYEQTQQNKVAIPIIYSIHTETSIKRYTTTMNNAHKSCTVVYSEI